MPHNARPPFPALGSNTWSVSDIFANHPAINEILGGVENCCLAICSSLLLVCVGIFDSILFILSSIAANLSLDVLEVSLTFSIKYIFNANSNIS